MCQCCLGAAASITCAETTQRDARIAAGLNPDGDDEDEDDDDEDAHIESDDEEGESGARAGLMRRWRGRRGRLRDGSGPACVGGVIRKVHISMHLVAALHTAYTPCTGLLPEKTPPSDARTPH
jgi:hypothetical protein